MKRRAGAVLLVVWLLGLLPLGAQADSNSARPPALPRQPEAQESQLSDAGSYRGSGRVVRLLAPAALAFQQMQEAARQHGIEVIPISGFRNRAYQRIIYERAVRRYGRGQRWVARPGYSPHHTGRALDLGDGAAPECDVKACFRNSAAYAWLMANGHRFGFQVMRSRTWPGRITEPWHWHYVEPPGREELASAQEPEAAEPGKD